MTVRTKLDWVSWHAERAAFKRRETEGITRDMEALKAHILKLQDLAPKDGTGFPSLSALNVLDTLRRDYDLFQHYLDYLKDV